MSETIRFECPSCDAGVSAPARAAGKESTCPSCGGLVWVPKPSRKVVKVTVRRLIGLAFMIVLVAGLAGFLLGRMGGGGSGGRFLGGDPMQRLADHPKGGKISADEWRHVYNRFRLLDQRTAFVLVQEADPAIDRKALEEKIKNAKDQKELEEAAKRLNEVLLGPKPKGEDVIYGDASGTNRYIDRNVARLRFDGDRDAWIDGPDLPEWPPTEEQFADALIKAMDRASR